MVHQLYHLKKIPHKRYHVPNKNDTKTQQYYSVESSKLKREAWMSVLKFRGD